MAHTNAFGGEISRWAIGLAKWALCELVRTRSHGVIVSSCEGVPCAVLPAIAPDHIRVLVLYGCKRMLSVKRLTEADVEDLTGNWRNYARGFLVFELDPRSLPMLTAIDHDCTRTARSALLDEYDCVSMPSLAEIDLALGTSLELSESKPLEYASQVINASHHRC